MEKQLWKPGNMIYPLPAVMVSVGDADGNTNIITVAWTGTICTNPAMAYISVRPERYSYEMIRSSGEFVINLTTKDLVHATDYCGVKSGRDVDKWKETRLTRGKAEKLRYAPTIVESPVNIECKVTEVKELGSHHMFLATVEAVQVDGTYMSAGGKFELNQAELLAYSHGSYLETGRELGTFGSVSERRIKARRRILQRKIKRRHRILPRKVTTGHSVPGKIDRRNRTKNVCWKSKKKECVSRKCQNVYDMERGHILFYCGSYI